MRLAPKLLPLAALLFSACVHSRHPLLAITHVSVIDVQSGTTTPDQTVLIGDGRILSVDSTKPVDAHIIDGTGRYLIPGLWGMHVHMEAADLRAFLAFGITDVRDMGGDLEELLRWRRKTAEDPSTGPRIVLAGPVLRGPQSDSDSGSSGGWVIRSAKEGRHAVDSLAVRGVDFIKVHEGLSPEAYLTIANEAGTRHLSFVGHVPASLSPIQVSDAGERSIEHFEFLPDACLYLLGPSDRKPSTPPEDCTTTALDSLFGHLGRNSTWLDPTIGSFRIFAPQQFPEIVAGFAALVPEIKTQQIRVLARPDLGTRGIVAGAALPDELELLVRVGFSPLEALQAVTSSPAEFLGMTDSLGAIATGKIADLVLLRANPLQDIRNTRAIAVVIRGGRVEIGRAS